MANIDFKISFRTVCFLVVGNILLTVAGSIAKLEGWGYAQLMLTISLVLFFTVWVIVLSDMAKQKIYNKTFWVLCLFILPTITPLFYLLLRRKLIRLGNRKRF
jgi:hypothetical protein